MLYWDKGEDEQHESHHRAQRHEVGFYTYLVVHGFKASVGSNKQIL
jgi:hypothetical protein